MTCFSQGSMCVKGVTYGPSYKSHKEFNTCEYTINQVLMSLLALFIYRIPKALSALTSCLVRRTEKIIGKEYGHLVYICGTEQFL